MQFKEVLASLVLVSCCSCSTNKAHDSNYIKCEGKICHGSGRLIVAIGGYGGASLETPGGCLDLALPNHIFNERKKWNGRKIGVSGEIFSRPSAPEDAWYDIKDRRIESGGCGSRTLYVEEINLL
ncbi:hypothetical protein [Tahibacter harae]|uniref:Uncharacterized protein n=1 Tax=Tahibacter harae TaxID=2963937 RepID=A0ABT1QKS5_9GAMM|nr:hypothetical protein [Tahibacter harae]MCQ4163109.1 hypothetical protein [Tahibacter harae]